jgi:alpha-mannosidase
MLALLLLLPLLLAGAAAAPRPSPRPVPRSASLLNVHIVAHTHDDVGWLKSVDELYAGLNNGIQRARVKSILNSVVASLAQNAARRFIYVEMAFFSLWWAEADAATQALTHRLVESGQLEFISGGWSMEDNTDGSFGEQIDQTTVGHRFLLETFNVTPRATWSIDPWGHTAFQATYMSSPLAGFSSTFAGRIDWEMAQQRRLQKSVEVVWAPSASQGLGAATLFSHLYNCYQPPPGFDMNLNSDDSPVVDNPALEGYNLPEKVDAFVSYAQQQASAYRGNDIIFTMGSDFNYENADTWFSNLDAIIKAVNADGRVNAFYSTPSAYAESKLASVQSWPLYQDDFTPYSEYPHAYHTGSFTSRAALKGYVRESASLSAAARLLQAVAVPPADAGPSNALYKLETAQGVAQHHDAVAGTSKQAVAYDYALRIAKGRADAVERVFAPAFAALTGYTPNVSWALCDLANATICAPLEAAQSGATIAVLLFNSQAQATVAAPVMLPVPTVAASYAVADADSRAVIAQLLPLSAADLYLRSDYYSYSSGPAVQWLAFEATLPPGGFAVYFVTPVSSARLAPLTHASAVMCFTEGGRRRASPVSDAANITNGRITLTFSVETGLLARYVDAATGVDEALSQELRFYAASDGDWSQKLPAAGAYFMRPALNDTTPLLATGESAKLTIVTGPVVSEARQVFGAAWAGQTFRLWAGAADATLQFDIGAVNVSDGVGKEIVSVIAAPAIANNGAFFTDANGRDSVLRVRDKRSGWNYTVLEPVAANFYPINAARIADPSSGLTLSVVTDRAAGVSSMADGELTVVVQRRLLHDDQQGVGEPLSEPGLLGGGIAVRVAHRLSLAPAAGGAGALRRAALADALYRPVVAYAALATGETPSKWVASYSARFSALAAALPPQLHLLTAHRLSPARLLLRLSHSFEAGEDARLSAPASVDLAAVFSAASNMTLAGCVEQTVTANQPLAKAPQVTYRLDNGTAFTLPVVPPPPQGARMTVTLAPMEIRTFLCEVI